VRQRNKYPQDAAGYRQEAAGCAKPFLTQKQTADVLGISPSTICNMVKDGVLSPVGIYKRAMFRRMR
jgi:hypothetical protein